MQQTTTTTTTTAPPACLHLTPTQHTILHHLYRYRFLNRQHIQQLLNHKNHKPIHDWLNDLTTHNLIGRIYSPHFPDNTKPAIYYLKAPGIALLRKHGGYDLTALRTRYRDHQRTATFRQYCLTIAGLAIALRSNTAFQFVVPSDYPSLPEGRFLVTLAPHALITKTEGNKHKPHLLELLTGLSPARIRARLKQYLAAYAGSDWEAATREPFPTVLLVFPTLAELILAKRWLKRRVAESGEPLPSILFTTVDELFNIGFNGEIWEGI